MLDFFFRLSDRDNPFNPLAESGQQFHIIRTAVQSPSNKDNRLFENFDRLDRSRGICCFGVIIKGYVIQLSHKLETVFYASEVAQHIGNRC
ncbi:hypothetical protein D3C84_867190 [compost metagenome]